VAAPRWAGGSKRLACLQVPPFGYVLSQVMVLAPELLPFAENFYRRFPEEFIALGAPGLDQIYDLRIDGTRSRRMLETPTEKTVEITIRRHRGGPPPPQPPMGYGSPPWAAYPDASSQPMSMAFPRPWSPGAGPPQGFAGYGAGIPPPQAPQQAPYQNHNSATPNPQEAQMASQLARLEGALAAMMPQVEAAMRQNPQAGGVAPANNQNGQGDANSRVRSSSISPSSPLRDRRKMASLQVQPPHKVADPGHVQPAEPAVKPLVIQTKAEPKAVSKVEVPVPKIETKPEKPRINAVRMVPLATDPESPRSPGRYSAWK